MSRKMRSLTSLWLILQSGILALAQPAAAAPFEGLSEAISGGAHGNLKAVLVAQDGNLLYEEYFRGTQASDLHMMHSVTKSVGSALIGIANRKGDIALDQELGEIFTGLYAMHQFPYFNKSRITVEQILQQRHGVLWDEHAVDYRDSRNPVYEAIVSGDYYAYFLRRPIDALPGQEFTYSTMSSTLMGRMLRWATDKGPRQFAVDELFGPLGITKFHWEGYSDQGRGNGLTDWPNPDKDEPLGFGLWLKPRDMLKFGELYRNGGVYDGRRILESSWVEASWTPYSNTDNSDYFADRPGGGHGYQWWAIDHTDRLGRTFASRYAAGWGRQFITILPALDLVVVSTSDDYDYDGPGMGALLREIILPELSMPLDERFDGVWYDPGNDGQGLTLQVLDKGSRLLGFWYTWDLEGQRRWFMLDGPIEEGVSQVRVYQAEGGVFLRPDPVTLGVWGTGRFSTLDCNHVSLEIDSAEIKTTVTLTRLTGDCEEVPVVAR